MLYTLLYMLYIYSSVHVVYSPVHVVYSPVHVVQTLWLSGNPVAQLSGYRATVIRMLPQLVSLDNTGTRV